MKEANDMMEKMQEISSLASTVSDRFDQVAKKITDASQKIGEYTKTISKAFGSKDAKMYGEIAQAGAELVGGAVNLIGGAIAKRKEKKLKEKLLPQKQEIATAKKSVIQKFIPMIQKSKEQIKEITQLDASSVFDYESETYPIFKTGLIKSFEGYFIFKNIEETCFFFLAEFDAWLKGFHESTRVLKRTNQVYKECVLELISWSKFPSKYEFAQISTKLSSGGLIIFSEEKISAYANTNKMIQDLSVQFAEDSEKKKTNDEFKMFFEKHLKYNYFINNIKDNRKKTKSFFIGILSMVIVIGLILNLFVLKGLVGIIVVSVILVFIGGASIYFVIQKNKKQEIENRYSEITKQTQLTFDLNQIV